MSKQTALISGVTGVVGARLATQLTQDKNWNVIGLSRRIPDANSRALGVDYRAIDVNDRTGCESLVSKLPEITHFFNASRYQHSTTEPESIEINTDMFLNLLEPLDAQHPLQHVHLVQGSKYYGSTIGRYPTPARETDARSLLGTFYFTQEDEVIERTKTRTWTWSASRPHGICDPSPTIVRSMARLIGVYAAICKELGIPLSFPGTEENYRAVYQCTEATHLAKAIIWMSTQRQCGNQAFNVTNGDYVRWERLWPQFADYFGMRCGPVVTSRMAKVMADKAPVWDRIVVRHGLRKTPFAEAAIWSYGDFIFTPGWDMMSSTTKLRQFGFADVVDTEGMFFSLFDALRKERVIP